MWNKIYWLASFSCFVLGLGGLHGDIQGWGDALNWLNANVLRYSCNLTGECGRWLFVIMGIVFVALATDLPRTLWTKYGWTSVKQEKSGDKEHQADAFISEPAYLTAYETIHYLADESQWGQHQKMAVSDSWMRKQPLLEAFGEFQRVAAEGKIMIYGRLNESGGHVPISHTYWMSAGLETHSVLSKQISRTVPTVPSSQGIPTYSDLKIVAENVYAAWPR